MEKRNLLLVISGPSGAGKGTICQALLRRHPDSMACSISATSRDVRPGEVPDQSYYYIGKEEFEERLSRYEFLEYAHVYGNYYGTLKKEVERLFQDRMDVILEIEKIGRAHV